MQTLEDDAGRARIVQIILKVSAGRYKARVRRHERVEMNASVGTARQHGRNSSKVSPGST